MKCQQTHDSRKTLRPIVAAILIVALGVFGVSGCKYSDTITELVPDLQSVVSVPGAPHVKRTDLDALNDEDGKHDDAEQPEDQPTSKDAEDPNENDQKPQDEKTNPDQKTRATAYDENPSQDSAKAARTKTDAHGNNARATEGSGAAGKTDKNAEESAGTGDGSHDATEGDNEKQGADGKEKDGSEEDSEQKDGGDPDEASNDKDKDAKNDDDGKDTRTDLPSGKRIAAAGEMANIVQMLTGELRRDDLKSDANDANYLVATDSNFQNAVADKGVYPDEGVDQATVAWNETDGTKGGLNVTKLKKAKVDLVIYESNTDTISGAKDKLNNDGIKTLAVPELNQDSDIVEAVETIAEALAEGNDGDKDAIVKKAAEWETYHDTVLEQVTDKNGGWSMYNGYDFDGTEKSSNKKSKSDYKFTDIFWYVDDEATGADEPLTEAGVGDRVLGIEIQTWGYYPADHYLAAAGVIERGSAMNALNPAQAGQRKNTLGCTWRPATTVWWTAGSSEEWAPSAKPGDYGLKGGSGELSINLLLPDIPSTCMTYLDTAKDTGWSAKSWQEGDLFALGNARYPAVVVKEQEDKVALDTSRARSDGMWHYRGSSRDDFLMSVSGLTVKELKQKFVCLEGDFDVYVAPHGLLHSWLEGSTESMLLSAWARNHYYTDMSISRLNKLASDYYMSFYRNADAVPSDLDS